MAILRESTGLRDERLKAGGSSLADALANGVIKLFEGSIPASADDAITGTLVCEVTESGLAFAPGTATNGINLDAASGGIVSKDAAETWQGENETGGPFTVSYGVYFANAVADNVLTASTTAKRLLFDVNTTGATMDISTTNLVSGEDTVIATFNLTQPE